MKKITTVVTYLKQGSNKPMVCINGDIFVSQAWLTQVTEVPAGCYKLLIGSSIDVTYYAKDEVMNAEQVAADKKVAPAICTEEGKVVKAFTVEPSSNLMIAMLIASKQAA